MPRNRKVPGSYKKRGNSIRVTLTFEGERHRFTVPTTDVSIAKSIGSRKYAELVAGRERALAGKRGDVRISELLAEFERVDLPLLASGTQKSYRDSLKPIRLFFVDALGDIELRRVGSRHVNEFLAWRQTNRLNGSHELHKRTLQKDRAVLHRLFGVAVDNEDMDRNPVQKSNRVKRVDKHDPVIITDDQYDRLLDECKVDPMLHLYVMILGETGMRCESEALHLRWSDVAFDDSRITIRSGRDGHRTKSGNSRSVPITSRLMMALRAHFAQYRLGAYDGVRPDYVIHHEETRRQHLAGKRIRSLRNSFKRAAARAGLSSEFRQHDLRHRRVTSWLGEGRPPVAVQMAMGHSDLRTTMGYYKYLPEHIRLLAEDISVNPSARSRSEANIQSSGYRATG